DDLVVGVDPNDGLVLISRGDAEALAQKWSAVRQAKSWGELRELCPNAYAELAQMEVDRDDLEQIMTPNDSEPFDADQINAICDGNWPEWPASDMLDWLPDDLCEELGEIQDSAYNGSYLYLPADQYAEVIAALETRGYRCVPDQVLIDRAHGG
ncbi:MAG TPA: hypothetical protein VLA73_04265, partial [Burkholderiales bacterium]|nr:hypothetical protein [Burkholderiales bacterium]